MTKEDFLPHFSKLLNKKTAELLSSKAASNADAIRCLIDLSFRPEKEIAFRASWVLEHSMVKASAAVIYNLAYFLDAYIKQENQSCRRHYTNILIFFSKKQHLSLLSQLDLTRIVETTFEWLIDPKTPVAVQVNCMDILYNLKHVCDWVEEELREQIVFLLQEGTAAMQSRGKKLLERLGKE